MGEGIPRPHGPRGGWGASALCLSLGASGSALYGLRAGTRVCAALVNSSALLPARSLLRARE